MKDNQGYSINMIRVLIGQCARAWNLQLSPPLKSWGMGGNPGLQAKPFFLTQKASSHKLQDPRTTVKFHGTRTEGLDHDKTVVGMPHMEADLMG